MKKIILSIACLIIFAGCNQSKTAGAVSKEDAPVFQFEKEKYDFGEIMQGEKVSYDFKFKNSGKSPLIISSATASCGCTKPEYPKDPIKPGESGMIHVVFNSATKGGMQNKPITITANTVPAVTTVNLIGNVKLPKQ